MIRHLRSGSFVALVLTLAFAPTLAGESLTDKDYRAWEKEYKSVSDLVEKNLATGSVAIQPEHYPNIKLAAKTLTAEAKFNDPTRDGSIHATNQWYKRVADMIDSGKANPKNQQVFLQVFAPESARMALSVLESPQPNSKLQTGVSIARLMAKLAEYGQEDVLYVLLPLLDPNAAAPGLKDWFGSAPPDVDKTPNEGAAYYAAKGVAAFYAWRNAQQDAPALKNPDLEKEVLGALVRILRNVDGVSDDAPPERQDGFRVLRREVVHALGQSRNPAITVGKDEYRIAFEIGKVLHGAKVSPTPRMDERVEAAIALMALDPGLRKDYQPEYAASKVGEFIVLFGERFNQSDKGKKNPEEMKLLGVRLAEALTRRKQAKDASDYEKKLADLGATVLVNLDTTGLKGNPEGIRLFLEKEKANGESFYKDIESSALAGNPLPVKEHGEK
jgi:hypothetical protein